MIARVALALALLGAVTAAARADEPSEAEARSRFQRGLALYKAGLYDAAEEEFKRGYELKPLPLFLFNAAQAARRANHARRALRLYREFVARDPEASQHTEAEHYIVELEPLARLEPPEPAPAPAPRALTVMPVLRARPPRVRWYRDRLGGALAGTGAVAAIAGAVVLGLGGGRIQDAQQSYGDFDAAHQATPFLVSGGVLLGAGVALLAGAGVRYALVARRARVQVAAGAAPGGATFALALHF